MRRKEFGEREQPALLRPGPPASAGHASPAHADPEQLVWGVETVKHLTHRSLSKQDREDFLHFLDLHTFDGITEARKKRAARYVREFIASPDPAALLRTWWGDVVPEGRGAAVTVRAAQKHRSQQAEDRQRGLGVWILDNPSDIAGRIGDWRAIRGATINEVAERTGVPADIVAIIERTGYSPRGNRDAARIVKALRVPAIEVRSRKENAASASPHIT